MLLMRHPMLKRHCPMESVWLEDFIALAEHGSFVRAADARHVTQPAFSRRIRSLENWMGVDLFVRSPQGATLTDPGRHILAGVQLSLRQIYALRAEAQEIAGKAAKTLQFAATHSLSFTFFPKWIRSAEKGTPIEAVRLLSDSMMVCEQMLLAGQVQFLLCHRHPDVPSMLPAEQFVSKKIGTDVLVPLGGTAADFGNAPESLPYLAYSEESGLGRIVTNVLKTKKEFLHLKPLFISHLAAVLMSMSLDNKGVAWLPKRLSEQEVADGHLFRVLDESWDIPLEIHLTRPVSGLSVFAEDFWARLD